MRTLIIVCLASTGFLWAAAETPAEDHGEQVAAPAQRRALLEQLRELEAAGASASDEPSVQRAYIDILSALGYHDLVAEQYARQLKTRPDDPALLRALGEAWMHTGPGGRAKAFDALHRALALDGPDVETRALLAHLCHREGLYEQAAAHYDEVLSQEPTHTRAQLGRAALMARDGDILEASAILDALGAAAQPFDVETRVMLRSALFVFEQRNGWFEDTGQNHGAYAKLLYRAGRIADAMLAARRAVTLVPDDYATWNFFAAMQLQLGNLEQGEQAYAKSLEANPDQPNIDAARRRLINEMTLRAPQQKP